MGIDHCSRHILVPEKFLNSANIVTFRKQMCGKRVAQTVAVGPLHNACRVHSSFERALQYSLGNMVPLLPVRARVDGKTRRRKRIVKPTRAPRSEISGQRRMEGGHRQIRLRDPVRAVL